MSDPWPPELNQQVATAHHARRVGQEQKLKARRAAADEREQRGADEHRKKHRKTALEAATTYRERKQLIATTMARALEGDAKAADTMMARISPALKPQTPTVQFAMDLTDAPAAARSILTAVSEGKISTEQGKDLLAGLNHASQIGEMQRLAQEVATLREQVANANTHALPPTRPAKMDEDALESPSEAPTEWVTDW